MGKKTKNTLVLARIAMVCVTDGLIVSPYCVLVDATSQTTELTDEVETITAVCEMEG